MKIVIFCGGYGTRMWPASRKSYPKQFYPLLGGKSFFQNTVERFEKKFKPQDIIVSTEHKYAHFIHEQAPEIPKENIILEPERRDNLGAIGLTTALLHKRFPEEVLFFSWSDHLIKNEVKFLKAVETASQYAKETGRAVSIDQEPAFPSVHNGWVKMGDAESTKNGFKVYQIDKFIEKPNIHVARRLFKSSKYLLHTGYCAWRSDTLLSYYKKYAYKTYLHITAIAESYGAKEFDRVLKDEYAKIEKLSIDYGLYEKIPSHERLIIPVDVGWQDAGTWQLMYESLAQDEDANLIEGGVDTHFIESDGNLVVGPKGKAIAIIGISNIAVIDTKDGLLVSSLDHTKDVKEIFATLEKVNPKYVD